VKLAGCHSLAAEAERAYALLQDPQVLAKSMPGCDELKLIGPDAYEMKMKMVISSIQGLFAGKVRIEDRNPPHSFKLVVEGAGKVGFMKGSGVLQFTPREGFTEVAYHGEVQVGGMIAGVGQRLVETTAKFLIRKFFEKLAGQIAPAASPETVAGAGLSPPG